MVINGSNNHNVVKRHVEFYSSKHLNHPDKNVTIQKKKKNVTIQLLCVNTIAWREFSRELNVDKHRYPHTLYTVGRN